MQLNCLPSWTSLLPIFLLLGCGPTWEEQATEAAQAGDFELAAEFYTRAAAESSCPPRAEHLERRAEVQLLAGAVLPALESLDKAVRNCPDRIESYWLRAQLHAEMGDREAAMADAARIQEQHPEAAALYSELAMTLETEQALRDAAAARVVGLRDQLDLEAADRQLSDASDAVLAREVPRPSSLTYQVQFSVDRPKPFTMRWEEFHSYRGDAARPGYTLVRRLDVPKLERSLPQFFVLMMSRLKLPMRFVISPEGQVLEATWLSDGGPDRGMRPEMLRPEVEGMLKRRRIFDPGATGRRRVGERWRGEDIRIVDGKAVAVEYSSMALGWVETLGVRSLHVRSTVSGEGYEATEEVWLHRETAVLVRWDRRARYSISGRRSSERWAEHQQAALVSITGVE